MQPSVSADDKSSVSRVSTSPIGGPLLPTACSAAPSAGPLPVNHLPPAMAGWTGANRIVVVDPAAGTVGVCRHGFDHLILLLGPPEIVDCRDDDGHPGQAHVQRIEWALATHRERGLMVGHPSEMIGLRYFRPGSPGSEEFAANLPTIIDLLWPSWCDELSPSSEPPLTVTPGHDSVFTRVAARG